MRAGSSLVTDIGVKPSSAVLASSSSRFLPEALSSTRVVMTTGIASWILRLTTSSKKSSSVPSSTRRLSHSAPLASRCG